MIPTAGADGYRMHYSHSWGPEFTETELLALELFTQGKSVLMEPGFECMKVIMPISNG